MNRVRMSRARPSIVAPSPAAIDLVAGMRFELVPLAGAERVIADLPPGAPVSVTCSPTKGLGPTIELTNRLLDRGHEVVPHFAARMFDGPEHVTEVARWVDHRGIREVFVIAGDATDPLGPYDDSLKLLRALLDRVGGLRRVGVAAYPDGHPLIGDRQRRDALLAKQALLAAAGVEARATTQMCFDAGRVRRWLVSERSAGLIMPVELGIPGVVERARLLTMGLRLGIGASVRFLRKQRSTMSAVLGGYDPTPLITNLAADAESLDITGLHAFTFNAVAATVAWQRGVVDGR